MGYVGVPPQSGFITTAKQRITSSTNNYVDLDHSISSLADVIVWVNFVKQDSTNLTLTTSSRITLGATLVASDIVEIAYLGKAVATQTPSSGTVTNDMLAGSIANSKLATDPLNASNLASGTVPTTRLGSGTASSSTVLFGDQTFKTAPSGAMTLIARNSGSSAIGNIGLDNIFSDTYDYYKIYMWVNAVASGGDLYWRFRKNGSDRTDSHYRGVSTLSQVTSSAESVSSSMQIWSNTFFQLFNNANNNANMGDALDITVFDPRARDEGMIATLQASITQYRADNVFRNFRWSGQYGNQGSGDDFDGFKIYYTNSDIRYYDYAIYGMNKT